MPSYIEVFDWHFREWAATACQEYRYKPPGQAFYAGVRRRLTDWTLAWVGYGINKRLILEHGFWFNVAGNTTSKRYKWFPERRGAIQPNRNWEYYIQVACFASLWEPCQAAALSLTFEDKLMDLAVRRDGQVLWCIEVKEQAIKLERLLEAVAALGVSGVDIKALDRGKDPLRKAKYIVTQRPEFFSGVAIGLQLHFRVLYPGPNTFSFVSANPPVNALPEPPVPPDSA